MTAPEQPLPYTVDKVETVAETPQLRAKRFTLASGQEIPWHYHTDITDRFYCLEGTLCVETRAPRHNHVMTEGGDCEVGPKIAHHVFNGGEGVCRFLILQGVGTYDYIAVGGGRSGAD